MEQRKTELKGYYAAKRAVGWRDLSSRGKARVDGPDRVSFLHAMISNEVARLEEFSGRHGTFLTAAGKIIADFWYYRFPDYILIDASAALLPPLIDRLRDFIIMDDVELSDVSSEFDHLSLHGPASPALLQKMFGAALPRVPGAVVELDSGGSPFLVIRKSELAGEEFELIFPRRVAGEFRGKLALSGVDLGLEPVSEYDYELLRVERGIPLFGIDMSEKNNPLEARISSAYSLSKGCYPGQEVVAKATNIGGVARLLCRLLLKDRFVPARNDPVFDSQGTEVGWVTSAVDSPDVGAPLALAYLKRAVTDPGTVLYFRPAPSLQSAAEVVEEFP